MTTVYNPKLVRQVAHTLWLIDFSLSHPDARAPARKADWADRREIFQPLARQLIRQLERDGVGLHLLPEES